MRFEKLIASFLAALMTILTAASPILAATALGTFPSFLTTTTGSVTSLNAYIVVGKAAMPEDVIAAADIAATLGSSTSYNLGSSSTTSTVAGLTRDGINVCSLSASSGTCNLTYAASGLTAFPTGNLTNAHFSGLQDSTVRWQSGDYDYHEQVDVSGVYMDHNLGSANINGTEKLVVGTSGKIKYEYVFEKEFNFTVQDATKGTIAAPQYTYPYKFKLLGVPFTLVGVGATSVAMLSGSTGTATATKSVDYGNYKFYATIGSTNAMQIDVKDASGNPVETMLFTGITSGTAVTKTTVTAKTADGALIDVTLTSFGTLTDGTVIGCDLVIGPTGTTTKTYDATADVDTTGSANDAFPGAARWGIQYHVAGTGADLKIPSGSWIEVRYMPLATEYYVAGSSISLPNNYGVLKFEGWNTDKFATISVKAGGPYQAYTVTNKTTVALSDAYGFEISSSPDSIGSTSGNYYEKAYILFSPTGCTGCAANNYPVAVGFKDKSTGKILVSNSAPGGVDDGTEYAYDANLTTAFTYTFTLSYGGIGENSYALVFSIQNATVAGGNGGNPTTVLINYPVKAGVLGSEKLLMDFRQFSSGTGSTWGTSAPQFMLGNTSTTGEDCEVVVQTTGSSQCAGKKSTEIVTDDAFLLQSTSDSTSSNGVTWKIPSKTLAVKVSFGNPLGTTSTTGTYKDEVVVTSPVAVLDSEVTANPTLYKAKDLIVVGGPCVNTIAQSLVDSGKLSANYTCAGGVLGSAWSTDVGYIVVIDDAFTTGSQVLFVAGTKAAQTRTAALVLQQYQSLLAGLTGSSYKITAATTAGITAV
jgi:hypothetical protein